MSKYQVPMHNGAILTAFADLTVLFTRGVFDPTVSISPKDFILENVWLVYLAGVRSPVRLAENRWMEDLSERAVVNPFLHFQAGPSELWLNPRHSIAMESYAVYGDSAKADLHLTGGIRVEAWGDLEFTEFRAGIDDRPISFGDMLRGLSGWRLHVRDR